MYIPFSLNVFEAKSYGIEQLRVQLNEGHFMVNMTAGSENSMIKIENYQQKWFTVVDSAEGDCKSHPIRGLDVVECHGNLRVVDFEPFFG